MALANKVYGISPRALCVYLINGLQIDIPREVLVQNPNSLLEVASLTKPFEEKYITTFKSTYTPTHTNPTLHLQTQTNNLGHHLNHHSPYYFPTPLTTPK